MFVLPRQLIGFTGGALLAVLSGCATSRSESVVHRSAKQVTVSPSADISVAEITTTTSQPESTATSNTAAISQPKVIEQTSLTTEVVVPTKPYDDDRSSTSKPPEVSGFAIDLGSALQMACGQNPNVALARERINEAYAQQARAEALWLPSIRAGVNWNKHEGRIQDVAGNAFDTSRGSYFGGFGANAVGAGSPVTPGVFANFHLADAIHQPQITEHAAASKQYSATVAEQDLMLQTATAHLELLRAHQERAIADDIQLRAEKLVALTKTYADAGEGLAADHDRARTELALRRNEVWRADEAVKVASARLAQLLHVDPNVELLPSETTVVPLTLLEESSSPQQLVADGLSHRAEVCEQRQLIAEACQRLRREVHAPLLPSVLLGVSYGGFGGGLGNNFRQIGDRFDADAVAYWELRNLGLGERAARAEAHSKIQQARWREVATLDRIAREVVEANTQVTSRRKQLAIAEEGIQAATSSYEKNSERIENAQGLPLETLQSLQALALARREYLRTVCDYNVAQFQLLRALGWPQPKQ